MQTVTETELLRMHLLSWASLHKLRLSQQWNYYDRNIWELTGVKGVWLKKGTGQELNQVFVLVISSQSVVSDGFTENCMKIKMRP